MKSGFIPSVTKLVTSLKGKRLIPFRFWIGLLGGLSAAFLFANRAVLAVAIVVMAGGHKENSTNGTDEFHVHEIGKFETGFNWSHSIQGHILSAYFYGYTLTQVFTGIMADKMNPAKLTVASHFLSVLLTLLIPLCSDSNLWLLLINRAMNGLIHGPILACYYGVCRNWFPQSEQPLALSVMLIGANVGVAILMPLTAFICDSEAFFGGWRSSFYFFGFLNAVFVAAWCILVTLDPDDNKYIDKAELSYIRENRVQINKKKKMTIQWIEMMKSKEIWAISISKGANTFTYNVIANKLPSFFENHLHLPLRVAGIINTGIFLSFAVGSFFAGRVSGIISNRKTITTTVNRKIFQGLSGLGPAFFCLMVMMTDSVPIIVLCFALALFFNSFYAAGDVPNVVDIAPDLCGTVFGIINTFSCVTSVLSPLVVGLILDSDSSLLGNMNENEKWSLVFLVCAVVSSFGAVIFIIFASSDVKPWGIQPVDQDSNRDAIDSNNKETMAKMDQSC